MLVYKVGGTVRDAILGRRSADDDHVVIGQTPEAMLKEGFRQVGADFPVFIDPRTGAEYALARTERKQGKGHKGFEVFFDPSVTLEEDLLRRDFTINAMALGEDGNLIDPFNGRRDVSLRFLRHVSEAFCEDPLRVLRAARLSAELGFSIAPETLELMRQMSQGGELDHLVAERVWQEISRGLMSDRPSIMVEALRSSGALAKILPEVDAMLGVEEDGLVHPEGSSAALPLAVVDNSARTWCGLDVRLAALLHDAGKAQTSNGMTPGNPGHEQSRAQMAACVCERMRVPKRMARSVVTATREHSNVDEFAAFGPGEVVDFLARVDAMRDRRHLDCLLSLCDCDYASHPSRNDFLLHPGRDLILRCLEAAQSPSVSKAGRESSEPADAVRDARLKEVEKVLAAASD